MGADGHHDAHGKVAYRFDDGRQRRVVAEHGAERDVDQRGRRCCRDPLGQRFVTAGGESFGAEILGRRDVRARRGLQAGRVDVEVEVVVAPTVGPGLEPMRSPQRCDLRARRGDALGWEQGAPKAWLTLGMASAAAAIGPANSAASHTTSVGDHACAAGMRSTSIEAARTVPNNLGNMKSGRSGGGRVWISGNCRLSSAIPSRSPSPAAAVAKPSRSRRSHASPPVTHSTSSPRSRKARARPTMGWMWPQPGDEVKRMRTMRVSHRHRRRGSRWDWLVELEGIEPSSDEGSPHVIRPFPVRPLAARTTPGRTGRSPAAGSFPEASGLSHRQPSLRLSPSASVTGLR